MKISPASLRFIWRFIGATIAYGVLLTAATWVVKNLSPAPLAVIGLSILPAIAIAASLIVTGLYLIEETDEYVRRRQVVAMLVSIGILLTLSTALGFLQQRGALGSVDLLWAFPAWCILWSITQCLMAIRDYRRTENAA
ncbi:hypothetical protein [Sphingomonas sp. LT1P40]|uniref:hypothetical protein n=1 Tax=Alteristakelama amylovorans TaxID=3096166 RepID=UPI002FC5B3DC